RSFLLGEGLLDRKQWLEHRLEELARIFSVSLAGFTVMDNHLHLLVRLDPEAAAAWSDEEVVRRWGRLFPPRDRLRRPLPVSDEWVKGNSRTPAWVATARERLRSLSCNTFELAVTYCRGGDCEFVPPLRRGGRGGDFLAEARGIASP